MRPLAVLLYYAATAAAVERWFDVCPESDAVIHAWARTTVRFDAPCKTVKSEMLARIAGKNGWVDPHNAGTYALTSSVGDVSNKVAAVVAYAASAARLLFLHRCPDHDRGHPGGRCRRYAAAADKGPGQGDA